MNFNQLYKQICSYPRFKLAFLPTPLTLMPQLSQKFKDFNLFIKRDDLTGLAFGGNKNRKLEYIIADLLNSEHNSIITWGGINSNWCRQTAAAAANAGIECHLLLFNSNTDSNSIDGNNLLNHLFNASIYYYQSDQNQKILEFKNVETQINRIIEENNLNKNKLYIAPIGGSLPGTSMTRPLGVISYINAYLEILTQSRKKGVEIDSIVLPTGSASTQAGLLIANEILNLNIKIYGISVTENREIMTKYIKTLLDNTLLELNISKTIKSEKILVIDSYLGKGYGILDNKVSQAISLLAKTEGILLDPVYTGKAMSGLLDLLEKGVFKPGENILFLHTGGSPSLFPYKKELLNSL